MLQRLYVMAALVVAGIRSEKTEYPLYMIGSSNSFHTLKPGGPHLPMTDADALALSGFSYIEGSFTPDEIRMVQSHNPSVRFTSYVESATTYAGFESEGFRESARFYLAGNLTATMASSATKFELCQDPKLFKYQKGPVSPLVPSTTSSSVSDKTGYVTYIRIKDELMKIETVAPSTGSASTAANSTGVNSYCQTLSVTRRLDGTSGTNTARGGSSFTSMDNFNAAYAAGKPVLAPALVSTYPSKPNPRFTPGYHPRYNSTYGVDHLVNWTVNATTLNNFSGSWFDSFSPSIGFKGMLDSGGKSAPEWNLDGDTFVTMEFALASQHDRLDRIWKAVKSKLGYFPTILANAGGQYKGIVPNFLNKSYNTDTAAAEVGGDEKSHYSTTLSTPTHKPLDGFCLEGWGSPEGDIVKPGCWNGDPVPSHWRVNWQSEISWTQKVQDVMDASQNKFAAMPALGQAGCVASSAEAMPDRDQFEMYTYASFLLGVEPSTKQGQGPILGIPGYYVNLNMTARVARIHERYYWPIGTPTITHVPNDLNKYLVAGGHTTFRRPFTGGLVLINPSNKTDAAVPLGGTYTDPTTKAKVTAVTLPSHTGIIVLK